MDAASYHAWYETPRGAWIGRTELGLLQDLLHPQAGASLLDAGCGTGWFSAAFADWGLDVTGLDPDREALAFLRGHAPGVSVVAGRAEALPFADGAFDYAAAVTSLCFVASPDQAVAELWRVARRRVVLGVLHRRSLLYLTRRGRGGYREARWDLAPEVLALTRGLTPSPRAELGWAVFLPSAGPLARQVEPWVPRGLPLGAFLAVALHRPGGDAGARPT
ncbi:MAG: class I SAM-dependent methyltransferase [Chromatiaceae bacterium]|jgi:SAM-dependent methyltransferase|nr:class I SAM-dependent methyltransferase [Chromatiaceae bacterium]